jgi:hypothetical protein
MDLLRFSKITGSIILLTFIIILFNSAKKIIPGVTTTLVIIEEQENNNFVKDITPFSDGVYEALWSKNDLIFFDFLIEEPMGEVDNSLDIRPYMKTARESGADSILLIKFHYYTDDVKNGLHVKGDDIFYNFYSINELESIKSGKRNYKIDKTVTATKKNDYIKEIGIKFLNEIYK